MSSPQTWPPYTAGRDCSLGFCSVYCPQWCYFYFPPPPPPSHSNFTLSPLLIAIIVVITSAFFIVTGYLIALKYCNNQRRRSLTSTPPSSWLPPPSTGLDASLINKLTVYRYRHGDASDIPIANGDRDCSVCLGEFHDGDSLRLLPKCGHAFHKSCIDTWLSSHSNCPLCRAGVIGPVEYLIEESEEEEEGEFAGEVVAVHDLERERGLSQARRRDDEEEDADDVVIEIRDEGYEVRMAGESSAGRSSVSAKRSPPPNPTGGRGVDD